MPSPAPESLSRAPSDAAERLRVARASLKTERKHLQRLLGRLDADAAQAQGAELMREMGEILKIQLGAVPRGAERVELPVPWDPPRLVVVELRRDLSPAANVERLFRRARGFERGLRMIAERREVAVARLALVQQLGDELATLVDRIEHPGPEQVLEARACKAQIEAMREAVRALRLKVDLAAPPSQESAKIVRNAGGSLPEGVQLFSAPTGRSVLVGRSASANDALVTRLLRGRDLWFHVRDRTGAHVVLRTLAKAPADQGDIRACAMLAAHLSGIAKGDRIDVQCVPGKLVRKVKGAAPGSVYVGPGRTVRVDVDAAIIDAFYARRPPT